MSKIDRIAFASLVLIALAGCFSGLNKVAEPAAATRPVTTANSAPRPAGILAFQKTVYPITTLQCAACHASVQAPLFASGTLQDGLPTPAYALSKTLVNFDNPGASLLVQQAKNGHCRSALCRTDGVALTAAIVDWRNAETLPATPAPSAAPSPLPSPAPSLLTYAAPAGPFLAGNAISAIVPTLQNGEGANYSVSPTLPVGLALNALTGAISGTPSAVAPPQAYSIAATTPSGSVSASISLSVDFKGATAASAQSTSSILVGWSALSNHTFRVYRVSGTTLTLASSAAAGTTSVVLTGLTANTSYTLRVRAVNGNGQEDANTVDVQASTNLAIPAPSALSYSAASYTFIAGAAIAALTPTVTNGSGATYSINPTLPTGLSFSATNGVISGTPSAIAPVANYVVTATSAGGSTNTALALNVNFVGLSSATAQVDGSVSLVWPAISGHSFKVYLAGGATLTLISSPASGQTGTTVTGLMPNTTYGFAVHAVNGSLQEDSNAIVRSVKTAPVAIPASISCTAGGVAFRDRVQPVLENSCILCHGSVSTSPTSPYGKFPVVARGLLDPARLDQNYAAAIKKIDRSLANVDSNLILRVLLDVNHGIQLTTNDPDYLAIRTWVQVERDSCQAAATPAPTATPSPTPIPAASPTPAPLSAYWNGVTMMTPTEVLTKAALQIAGRFPTDAEMTTVEAGGLASIDNLVLAMMREPAFTQRIKEIFNDILLTAAMDTGSSPVAEQVALTFGTTRDFDTLVLANRDIAREPMEMVAFIVNGDRDIRELVQGQYRLLTPNSVKSFSAANVSKGAGFQPYGPAFPPYADQAKQGGDFAGVLGTQAFLLRYPNTPTNRNRRRARYVMKYFLAYDIMRINAGALTAAQQGVATPKPWKVNTNCTVCHLALDPMAGLFQNWTKAQDGGIQAPGEGVYTVNRDWWYPYQYQILRASGQTGNSVEANDMFVPGYPFDSIGTVKADADLLGTDAGSRASALKFLGDRVARDPRFPGAMVQHVFQGLTGRAPLAPSYLLDSFGEKTASDAQAQFFAAAGAKMVAGQAGLAPYNLKIAFLEVIKSGWFMAKSSAAPGRSELIAVGGGATYSPENLSRKVASIFGKNWTVSGGNGASLQTDFNLFLGGIDSLTVPQRSRLATGITSATIERMALEMSCDAMASNRALLLRFAAATDVPGTGDLKIRQNIQYLHKKFHGDNLSLGATLATDDPEIQATYALFKGVVDSRAAAAPGCISAASDANGVLRAWQAVTVYLMRDYKFLVE